MKRIIVDSAPLILLEKLSLLDEVGKRFHLVVPLELVLLLKRENRKTQVANIAQEFTFPILFHLRR